MRAGWAVFLVTMVAAAGCLTGEKTPDVKPPAAKASTTPPIFLPPVVVTKDTAEPGLAIDQEGFIWVHAPGGLWKSTDTNGTAFTEVDLGGIVFGGDADIAFGKDPKDVYYTDLEDLIAISVFSSHDGGKNWFYQPLASDAPITDRQWITTGPDPMNGGREAVYLTFNQLATGAWVTKSTDGGLTWTPHLAFAFGATSQYDVQTMGNIVVDSKGVVYVAVGLGSAGAPFTPPLLNTYYVIVLKSSDGGLTWSRSDVVSSDADTNNLFPILAVDPADNLYTTWSMEKDGETSIFLSRSRDQAATWSPPIRVSQNPGSHVQPWVAAGDKPGELALAWYETTEKAAPNDVKGSWVVQGAATGNGDQEAPTFLEFQISPEPVHEGPICTYGIACQGGRELLDFFQVRLGADDRVHTAYASNYKHGVQVEYQGSEGPLQALNATLPAPPQPAVTSKP